MPPQENDLGLIVYAPALASDDLRPLAVVHAMERTLPGLRLGWRVSNEGQLIDLPQRDAWVAQQNQDGQGFDLLCNGDESYPVMIYGSSSRQGISRRRRAQFEVHAHMPLDAVGVAAAPAVLEGIAEEARAYWGTASPFNAGVEISQQVTDPVKKPGVPPRGLPALKLREDLRSPEIPGRLGWLNYWSSAAAQAIGFPDLARDGELLSRARRTASGGWVVQLTETPLDLDNPAHLEALKRAYERFPEVGGRSAP